MLLINTTEERFNENSTPRIARDLQKHIWVCDVSIELT